jgi:chromosomal replication initiation ATPase DnaA
MLLTFTPHALAQNNDKPTIAWLKWGDSSNVALAEKAILDVLEVYGFINTDERALLHTYNGVAERGGHLLLTALAPPALWSLTLPDLVSRLRVAPAVAIGLPDDALLAALMVKLFTDRQIALAPEVPAYVVPRIERSFEAVAQLVDRLDRAALAERRPVTVPLVRRVLATGEGGTGTPPGG